MADDDETIDEPGTASFYGTEFATGPEGGWDVGGYADPGEFWDAFGGVGYEGYEGDTGQPDWSEEILADPEFQRLMGLYERGEERGYFDDAFDPEQLGRVGSNRYQNLMGAISPSGDMSGILSAYTPESAFDVDPSDYRYFEEGGLGRFLGAEDAPFSLDPYATDEDGYAFGAGADPDPYLMQQFSSWVGRGPEDWTQEEWDAYSSLSTDPSYVQADEEAGYQTVSTEFGDLAETAGIDPVQYAGWAHDPRMWELLQRAGAATTPMSQWSQADVDQFFDLTGEFPQSAGDLAYDETVSGDYGPWSYVSPEDPPSAPDPGRTAEDDAATIDWLQAQWEGDPTNVTFYETLRLAQTLMPIKAKLREMGADPYLVREMVENIGVENIENNEVVQEFLAYTPSGGDDYSEEDLDILNRLLGVSPEEEVEPTEEEIFSERYPGEDFWAYGPAYDQYLREVKYADPDTGEFYWTPEYEAELQESRANAGERRPGAGGRYVGPGGESPFVASGQDPFVQGGEFDPVRFAGTGPYATGIIYGGDTIAGTETPYGTEWSLGPPDYGDIPVMSDRDRETIVAAEDFFSYIRDDAIERGALDAYGDVDINKYWQTLERDEGPEYLGEMKNEYNYYGAEWERLSPDYYASMQAAGRESLGTGEHVERVEDLRKSLIPFANEVMTLMNEGGANLTLSEVVGFLSGSYSLPDTGTGGGGGTATGLPAVADQGAGTGGGASSGTASGNSADMTSATLDATNNSTTANAAAYKNETFNTFSPSTDEAMDILLGGQATSSVLRNNAVSNVSEASYEAIDLGKVPKGSGRNLVEIPNFVIDSSISGSSKLSSGSPVDAISVWNGLSESDQSLMISEAAGRGLDTRTSSYDNPEADLYQTVGDETTFYIPAWAAKISYPLTDSAPGTLVGSEFGEYAGSVPDYAWWQSIGAQRRVELQKVMERRGENTEVVPVRRMKRKTIDGKDVGVVEEAREFKSDESGDMNPVWSNLKEKDRDVSLEAQQEPLGFSDFITWAIDASDGRLDPMSVFNDNPMYAEATKPYEDDKSVSFWDIQLSHLLGPIGGALTITKHEGGDDRPQVRGKRGKRWYARPSSTLTGKNRPARVAIGLESVVPRSGRLRGRGVSGESEPTHSRVVVKDGVSIGTRGAFSRTMLNYFLKHWDAYVGPGNETKIPLPHNVGEDELAKIKLDPGVVHYANYVRGEPVPATTGIGTAKGTARTERKRKVDITDSDRLFGYDFDTPTKGTTLDNYGDVGRSSGTIPVDFDDFFSEFTKMVGFPGAKTREQVYASSPVALIDWLGDDGPAEDWYDFGGAYVEGDNQPLYFDDGSSAQAMWGALSLYIPLYEDYLQSHDAASTGAPRAQTFSRFLDSERVSYARPDYDPGDLGRSAVQALAYQQKGEAEYIDMVNDMAVLKDWRGNIVRAADYENVIYSEVPSYVPPAEQRNSGTEGWMPSFMFWDHDMSDRIAAPSNVGTSTQNLNEGGLVGIGYQVGGMVPPSDGIGSLPGAGEMDMPRGVENLEMLVQQDPLLQETVDALIGSHPNAQHIINAAIDKYGRDLIMALARMVQGSGARETTYVPGESGGLADAVPAVIDNTVPANLSSGEFVVPADVVGHLGDGNNENGAQKLHGMMDRVREEKTGRVEQPGPIDEEEVLPV